MANYAEVIVRTVFPNQSPGFDGEIAHLHCNGRSAVQVSYLAMTRFASYRELLPKT